MTNIHNGYTTLNIFYLSQNPKSCAQYHCNKHVISQIKESCQLLSTAHRVLDGSYYQFNKNGRKYTTYTLPDDREDILLKFTHMNHPCSLWVRESSSNYQWLHQLAKELCIEYTFRYNKHHAYETNGVLDSLQQLPFLLHRGSITPFTLAMPDKYKHQDPVQSYRTYYLNDKKDMLDYKIREIPQWIRDYFDHT